MSGYIKTIDLSSSTIINSVKTAGYPQCSVLVSDAYYKKTGNVYIYTTYNSAVGGITVITDNANLGTTESSELFIPDKEAQQYCICRIVADKDGTLYYKNDSGCLFAISNSSRSTNFFVRIITAIINFFKNLFN